MVYVNIKANSGLKLRVMVLKAISNASLYQRFNTDYTSYQLLVPLQFPWSMVSSVHAPEWLQRQLALEPWSNCTSLELTGNGVL